MSCTASCSDSASTFCTSGGPSALQEHSPECDGSPLWDFVEPWEDDTVPAAMWGKGFGDRGVIAEWFFCCPRMCAEDKRDVVCACRVV
jgi:hypothetical protein